MLIAPSSVSSMYQVPLRQLICLYGAQIFLFEPLKAWAAQLLMKASL